MLSARRKSDGQVVTAHMESKARGPFACLECGDPVILKTGRKKVDHFAHAVLEGCLFSQGESNAHRLCKLEIFKALQKAPGVRDAALERSLGSVRPDVSAHVNGVRVAIEVQISSLSISTIMYRTIEYHRKGIYVLWLLQWTPELENRRYSPRLWERWIHTTYFGRVYYWKEGLTVTSYTFEPHFTGTTKRSWYSKEAKKMVSKRYARRSKRYRTPVRGENLNLAMDFGPKRRKWWDGNGVKVPDAKLYTRLRHS